MSPTLGEKIRAAAAGYVGSAIYIWSACADCGKERWVQSRRGHPLNPRCNHCASRITALSHVKRGAEHPNWLGGRYIGKNGYVTTRVSEDSLFFSMAQSGHRILEHRLVMAQSLGRCLKTAEAVHHLNGIRTDNRIENLQIVNSKSHDRGCFIRFLQERIRKLELQAQMRKTYREDK